jgi:hypothetical protein
MHDFRHVRRLDVNISNKFCVLFLIVAARGAMHVFLHLGGFYATSAQKVCFAAQGGCGASIFALNSKICRVLCNT